MNVVTSQRVNRIGLVVLIGILVISNIDISVKHPNRSEVIEETDISSRNSVDYSILPSLRDNPTLGVPYHPVKSSTDLSSLLAFDQSLSEFKKKIENFTVETYVAAHNQSRVSLNLSGLNMDNDTLDESDSIEILNETDLSNINFSGSGSFEDPYVISNLNITVNETHHGIKFENIDSYVVLMNSLFIINSSSGQKQAAYINNSKNIIIYNIGIIGNNDTATNGIELTNSENILLFQNSLFSEGILVSNSSKFGVEENEISDFASKGIAVTDSFDFNINQNVIRLIDNVAIRIDRPTTNGLGNSNFSIFNNQILFDTGGVAQVYQAENFQIFNNQFTGIKNDLLLPSKLEVIQSSLFGLINNTISQGGRSGISTLEVEDALIGYNILSNFEGFITRSLYPGILTASGTNVTVFENILRDNDNLRFGSFNWGGIGLIKLVNSLIVKNHVENGLMGIGIGAAENLIIEQNILQNNRFDGIKIKQLTSQSGASPFVGLTSGPISDLIIRDNIIIGNTEGINAESIDNSLFENNQLRDNLHVEMRFESSDNIIIDSNSILGSDEMGSEDGIVIVRSTDVKIANNDIKFHIGNGILGSDSSNLQIENNWIEGNAETGIFIQQSIFPFYSSSTMISDNIMVQNGIGIQMSNVATVPIEKLGIQDNQIDNNLRAGISLKQGVSPISIIIKNNTISNHFAQGAVGLNIENPAGITDLTTSVVQNQFHQNLVGARFTGSGIYFSENLLSSETVEGNKMLKALELRPGSSNNVVIFNSFNNSETASVWIQSSNNVDDPTGISRDNLIAWNNFYVADAMDAYDQFSDNDFIYNYYDSSSSTGQNNVHDNFRDSPVLITSSLETSSQSSDPLPLTTPFNKAELADLAFFPKPIFNGIGNTSKIDRDIIGDNISLNWTQHITSDMFVYANRSQFSFTLQRLDNDAIIAADLSETQYQWDISSLSNGIYRIKLITTDLHTSKTSSTTLRLNIGPVDEGGFLANPINVVGTLVGGILLSSALVYVITTYRYNVRLRQSYDSQGQARSYLDFIRKMKQEDA